MSHNPNPKSANKPAITGKPADPAAKKDVDPAAGAAPAKPSGKEKAALRRSDYEKILKYALAAASKAEDSDMIALANKYMPKIKKNPNGPSWSLVLRSVMNGEVSKHEDAIWRDLKYGRMEMGNLIKDAIIREKAEFRYWVKYDTSTKNYVVVHEGEKAPEGWTGPLPKDQREAFKFN